MKKLKKLSIIVMSFLSLSVMAVETKYHRKYGPRNLEKDFQSINHVIDESGLKKILRGSRSCDFKLLHAFASLDLDKDEVQIPILKAGAIDLIDDVETEILMDLFTAYKKVRRPESKFVIQLKSGKKLIDSFYQSAFSGRGCLEDAFNTFKMKINIVDSEEMSLKDLIHELNINAFKKKQISENEYRILSVLLEKSNDSRLSLVKYKKFKRDLAGFGFKLNSKVTDFHIQTHKGKDHSLRYNAYRNLSAYHMNEMKNLIERLMNRVNASKGEVILSHENGEVLEKKIMSQMEQFHYGLKIYSIEKAKLKQQFGDKGGEINFQNLLLVAFELSSINADELDALFSLEEKVKEKTFLEKGFGYAKQYSFVVSSLTTPLIGTVYGLSLGLIEQYFFPPKKDNEKKYDHDLFYGNCEMNL